MVGSGVSDPSQIRYATEMSAACTLYASNKVTFTELAPAIVSAFHVRNGKRSAKASAVGGEDRAQSARDPGKMYEAACNWDERRSLIESMQYD